MIKVVSFDLDDTLSDSNFDMLIWNIEIPKAYAKEKGVSFDKAKKIVMGEYEKLWGTVKGDWRDVSFWMKHFKLRTTWGDLLKSVKHEIKHFPEVKNILRFLKQRGLLLIIITSAERKFLKAKLEAEAIENFFDLTFSAPSDFNKDRKDKEVYEKVLKKLKLKPSEMIHIGDHKERDFEIPNSLGIRSILIDRKEIKAKTIHSLEEIKRLF